MHRQVKEVYHTRLHMSTSLGIMPSLIHCSVDEPCVQIVQVPLIAGIQYSILHWATITFSFFIQVYYLSFLFYPHSSSLNLHAPYFLFFFLFYLFFLFSHSLLLSKIDHHFVLYHCFLLSLSFSLLLLFPFVLFLYFLLFFSLLILYVFTSFFPTVSLLHYFWNYSNYFL